MTQKLYGSQDNEIAEYYYKTFSPEDEFLYSIRASAKDESIPAIHVCEADGRHLETLIRFANAKKVVEIGTLAGYSGVCIARALPTDGMLYTFEMSEHHAAVAAKNFQKAELSKKVRQFVGPAIKELPKIESEGPFDVVFIDADKVGYPEYLEWAYKNLKMGGAVIADNVFAWGYVVDNRTPPRENAAAARELKKFNQLIASQSHWRSTILPTGEGLAIAVKVR